MKIEIIYLSIGMLVIALVVSVIGTLTSISVDPGYALLTKQLGIAHVCLLLAICFALYVKPNMGSVLFAVFFIIILGIYLSASQLALSIYNQVNLALYFAVFLLLALRTARLYKLSGKG